MGLGLCMRGCCLQCPSFQHCGPRWLSWRGLSPTPQLGGRSLTPLGSAPVPEAASVQLLTEVLILVPLDALTLRCLWPAVGLSVPMLTSPRGQLPSPDDPSWACASPYPGFLRVGGGGSEGSGGSHTPFRVWLAVPEALYEETLALSNSEGTGPHPSSGPAGVYSLNPHFSADVSWTLRKWARGQKPVPFLQ